jgi:tRNA pseudouridine55 synthase
LNEEEPENNEYDNKIILVDKPLDQTSANIVRIFKKAFRLKKIGHSGTLDPRATGLLILCTGKMTKKITGFIEYDKEYEGVIKIGARTRSYDTETEEEHRQDVKHISDTDIESASRDFIGEIAQIPPMHSAIKYKGKPLYKLARKGKEIERKPRSVRIDKFEVIRENESEIGFRITCSKGTYIRSIANDLGNKLGVGGYLKSLRRTRIGEFEIEKFEHQIDGIGYKVLN